MGTLLRSVLSLEASDRTPHDLMRSFMRLAIRKYKRFRGHTKAVWTGCGWLRALKRRNPNLFAHWSNLRSDDGSWMNREIHLQLWEGVGLRCPALLAYL